MNLFFKKFKSNCESFPDRIALSSYDGKNSYSYKTLWELTGKIYNYLSKKKIDKEDFVLVYMPRSIELYAALLGIWRAGAAATIIESDNPIERLEFIKKDCNVKFIIDESVWSEILNEETTNDIADSDLHDACFAIYTSGTTGTPKGVLQEYGCLENIVKVFINHNIFAPSGQCIKCANIAPANYLAGIQIMTGLMFLAFTMYVVPMHITKNLPSFLEFIDNQKITSAFLPPSFFKIIKKFPPCLKYICSSGESAEGIYSDQVKILNLYGSSESGSLLSFFPIDKAYSRTPAGYPTSDIKISILDEAGNEVPPGVQGEICFPQGYFRGYINLPELTAKTIQNGLIHSRDIGYIDEFGKLFVCGRMDNMIKLHGYRIEPEEIETQIRQIFNVKNVIAKGFIENEKAFIVLYYLNSEARHIFAEKSTSELNKHLEDKLPYYMLPAIYSGIDMFPINQSGKIQRDALKKPL